MTIDPNLIEEMEYYLTSRCNLASCFLQDFRKSFGKDGIALQNHQRILTEVQGIINFLEIVFGLEANSDEEGYYHLKEKEYY